MVSCRPARSLTYFTFLLEISLTRNAAIPHATIASDVYEGYYIPKGMYIVRMFVSKLSHHSRVHRRFQHLVG